MTRISQTEPLGIRNVVDLIILQRIQDTFSKALKFAAMVVDAEGRPVTAPSGFGPLCLTIRSTEAGFKRCMECDLEGGSEAHARQQPHVYVCKGGLIDIASPIVIKGEYLGSLYCGQVVPLDSREEFVEEIVRRNVGLGLPKYELRKAAEEIPAVPCERIDAAAELLFLVANYIIEMGIANQTKARLLEEIQNRADLQIELQQTQLRMLASQINPHFLFNTLGLIGYTAIREQAPQTEEIAYCLSDLLRYSLRNMTNPVTLGEELEIVEHYLAIQKLRFGPRLQVRMEIDPSLRQVRLPCMILQPLVENAVVHAVEPSTQPVTVQVRALPVATGLLIEVIDDGPGIKTETLASINSRTFTDKTGRTALGLQNVIRRLELEYGDASVFCVESESGHGTRITLILPILNTAGGPVA